MAKKLRFLFTLLFVMAATLSWGDNYTITFKTGSSDGTTVSTSTACSIIVSEGASYLKGNVADASKAYHGGSDGLKLGTSSSAGKIRMNLASKVTPTSIVVSAKLYNSSKSATLKVNGSTAQDISADFTDLTFAITSEISYIELESSKYCWIKSITVNYANDTRVSTTTSFPQNNYTAYLGEDFSAPVATLTANGGTLSEELLYSSSNTNVATVASDGSVSLKAKGTTTITATFAGNDNYIGSSASYTLKVENAPIIPKPINIGSGYYVKVTSADKLVDGDAILIVNESNKCAMSTTQNTNNRGQKIVTITNGIIDTPEETVQKIILVKSGDNWYLNVGENNNKNSFLYAASSSKNYLKSTTDPDNNALASISVTNGNATIIFQGDNTRKLLKYNSSDKLFSCYASGQQDIQIYKEIPVVAQIVNVKYETLQAAFDAATEGQTVTLLKDYDATKEAMAGGTRQFVINKSITFDGGGYTLTTKQSGIGVGNVNGDLSSNIDVTIKNVTINNTSSGARCIDTRGKIGSLTLEGVTLKTDGAPSGYTQPLTIGGNQSDPATVNITNSTIQTNDAGTAYYAIITFNPVNMTVTNSTIKGWANVYAKGADGSAGSAGSVFTLNGCTLVSSNAYSGESNAFGAFVMEDNNITINVTNSNVTLNNTGDQPQALVSYSGTNFTDNNVTFGEGNKIKFVEPGNFSFVSNPGENTKFTVSGGLFNVSVPENLCAEGMIPAANTDSETSATYPYTVKVGSYVAQVGEQKFETFDEAVAAVTEENNVITLLANVTEGYIITADKALNVNLNGFTLTVIAPEGYLLKTEEKDGVTTYSAIAPVAQIGDVKYETIAAAVAAAEEGQTVKVIKGGEYTLPGIAKNITIEGAEEIEVLFTHTAAGNIASIPSGATFKNVKFEFGNVNYHGFQHAGTINMEGCTLSGKFFSYGDMNFTSCNFVQTVADYNMWVYGKGAVNYTNCTFTGNGKFLHLYSEYSENVGKVTVDNCKFVNNSETADKAAINVKATCGEKLLVYDVIINDCTTVGAFPEANVTQPLAILNNLVQVDKRTADGVDNITVTHDGVQIYPIRHYVAQIGNEKYETLQDAFDAAEATEPALEDIVIDLLDDAELTISPRSNIRAIGTANTKSITINGNSHKLTFMTTDTDWNDVSTRNDTQTRLVLSDMTIDQAGKNDKKTWNSYDINFNCAVELNNVTSNKPIAFKNDATLKNVTINDTSGDYYGIWISPRVEGQNISIDGLSVTAGRGIKVDDQYVDNPEKVTLDIKNATFNTTKKAAIIVKSKGETAITVGEDVNIENVAADKVNTVWVDEDYADEFYKVAVEGATMVPESKEADYDACLMKGDQRWGFYEKVSSAIEKVEDGYSIKLFRTTTEVVSVVKTLTIVKNGFTAANVVAGEGFVRIETDNEIKIISASAVPTAPVVFHDSGKYEAGLSVPMYAQAGEIYYTIGESTEAKKYTGPLTINEDTKITAWSELNGVKSAVVTREYTIKAAAAEIEGINGYYSIKNNGNEKYINVAGRKTVTFVDDGDEADKAGTVLKVKINTKGQVEELRSQGVDLPGYAKKAMNYVPEIVQLVVDKLDAEGQGKILGENGLDSIMKKFNESFDYNLYLEKAGEGYRIYGKTPSMKPVVDFYAENKANVDIKLPQLEEFINDAIDKVLEKTGGRGASILTDFSLEEIWEKMGKTLTEPKDEASTAKFYEEVLSSEANVWNFAYQTAMKYWEPLINHKKVKDNLDQLGDYAKYLEKVENIQPDFKYYIVGNTSGNGVDFISEGNTDIQNNAARTIWTMNERNDFAVKFTKENSLNIGRELYTTLYVDFAYTLPETVKAYKVTAIDEKTGLATKEEITGVIPAQTPVLLMSTDVDNLTQTLSLSTEAGTAVTGNLLQGPDTLINAFNIKTAQLESLFEMAKSIMGDDFYNNYVKKYEHLMMKNAGTVNNKYFFGIGTAEDTDNKIYGTGTTLRTLFKGDKKLGFYQPQDIVKANTAFLMSEKNPVRLSLIGDVNRDGKVNITDVTAQIDIILGKDKPEDNYDYDAADVNGNDEIKITDVTDLIDIILGKTTNE